MIVNIIVGGLIAVGLFFLLKRVIKDMSNSGCGGGCAGCSSKTYCSKVKS